MNLLFYLVFIANVGRWDVPKIVEMKLKGEYHIMVVRGGGHADRVEFECINGGENARGKD